MTPAYNEAIKWLDMGVATIPVAYRSKRPDFQSLKRVGSVDERGRAIWETYKERLPTLEELKTWFNTKFRNVAVVTGWQNLVIIDFDSIALYGVWTRWAQSAGRQAGLATHTYKAQTARGMHVYLFILEALPTSLKFNGIDVKAAGGYCLADPSVHPSGHTYKALKAQIQTVDSLDMVLPAELLAQAQTMTANYVIPEPKKDSPWTVSETGKIAWIKRNYQILDFFPQARATRDGFYVALCPLHNDRHESFWINTRRGTCGCQAGCIQGSCDVIDLYARLHRMTMTEAIQEMSK